MEGLKQRRKVLRTAFSRSFSAFNALMGQSEASLAEIKIAFRLLEEKNKELQTCHEKILDVLMDEAAEEVVQKEYDDADEYKTKFITAQTYFNERTIVVNTVPQVVSTVTQNEAKKSFKLPKIELVKFGGDICEWLQFWSLFKKIHEDASIDKADKFHYLIQTMIPGSRAAELVKSYPPTSENYDKVIKRLKSRFGRDDLQIEVYVRELLQLVLQNATKSSKSMPLSRLYDKIESHLRALESLGVTSDKYAAMLVPLVESSLPEDLLRAWQRSGTEHNISNEDSSEHTKDRLTQLIKFLEAEVRSELRISMAVKGFDLKTCDDNAERGKRNKLQTQPREVPSARNLLVTRNKVPSCLFCAKEDHSSGNCDTAKRMSLAERQAIAKEKRACFNCLKVGHRTKECRVNVRCSKCSRRHVDVMCFSDKQSNDVLQKALSAVNVPKECNLATSSRLPNVFMPTLKVKMFDDCSEIVVRAVIDTGSQRSYVTRKAVERMNYVPIGQQKMKHLLFGGKESDIATHMKYKIRLANLDGNYLCNFEVLDEDEICPDIPTIIDGMWITELKDLGVKLTDICSEKKSVDVLIGIDIAGKLLTGRRHNLNCGLTAVETYLGWTLIGKVPALNREKEEEESSATCAVNMFTRSENVKELWSLDLLGIKDPIEQKTQRECEEEMQKMFLETVKINADGRYEVKLPWLECHPALKDNKLTALRRLQSTIKRLKGLGKYEDYNGVFDEWLADGIIERVPLEEESRWGHYLPHRPVFKEHSTTKIRPVFDASAKEQQSVSLNECLHKGPNLIELVSSILLRFRKGNVGVVSDIKRAFLQISIDEADRDFLRFLWYDLHGNLIVFRHCRVVFGVSCSPFILGAIINLHLDKFIDSAIDVDEKFSKNCILKLKESLYVDNCVTSLNNANELVEFIRESKAVMESGGFDLRGWEYNNDGNPDNLTQVLGIIWDKQSDSLSLKSADTCDLDLEKITKRKILSVAHRNFDPLGFVCPVSLCPKVLLQEAWAAKFSWDDEVSESIKERFLKWIDEMKWLKEIKIPRCMFASIDDAQDVTLHTFCDASKVAYAAVTFVRLRTASEVKVCLVQAKTRVAPVSNESNARVSIPRLELLAATIGARLTASILESLNLKNVRVYYWSDSSTVVAWIHRECNWGVFVSNRVKEIKGLSDREQWRHIPGHLNPADLPSRGCTAKQLVNSRWWEGPAWLRQEPEEWPSQEFMTNETEVNAELRKSKSAIESRNKVLFTVEREITKDNKPWFNNISSFSKLIRIFAWVQRFLGNSKRSSNLRQTGGLTVDEIKNAKLSLFKIVQSESFSSIDDERIKHFTPFVDEHGLIRMKTKISMRKDSFDFRFPILLPSDHYVVVLLIREKHIALNHAGPLITLNNLREEFWILKGRQTIRAIINKCVPCKRQDSRQMNASVAPLPLNRIRDATIFEIIGIDFAGPVYLKGSQKAWICIFTCAVYRAVHLELVSSLSVASLVMAIRRHIARRGRPSVIYSDNGTNFVGLSNALKNIDFKRLTERMAMEQIEWRFNPPAAPWWGGFWERLIGVLKRLLRRTLKRACLNYEEMATTLADCESVINSRPVTFLSDSYEEITPLTPSMFLQEIKEVGVVDLDRLEKTDWNKRYAYRQRIKSDLRQRFRIEYLGMLVHPKRNVKVSRSVKVGDIVLIGHDNLKRVDWPLARVKEIVRGKDGIVRVVRLITANGELTRPIQRIFPLELNQYDSNVEINKIVTTKFENKSKPNIDNCDENHSEKLDNTKAVVTRSGRTSRKPNRLEYH